MQKKTCKHVTKIARFDWPMKPHNFDHMLASLFVPNRAMFYLSIHWQCSRLASSIIFIVIHVCFSSFLEQEIVQTCVKFLTQETCTKFLSAYVTPIIVSVTWCGTDIVNKISSERTENIGRCSSIDIIFANKYIKHYKSYKANGKQLRVKHRSNRICCNNNIKLSVTDVTQKCDKISETFAGIAEKKLSCCCDSRLYCIWCTVYWQTIKPVLVTSLQTAGTHNPIQWV